MSQIQLEVIAEPSMSMSIVSTIYHCVIFDATKYICNQTLGKQSDIKKVTGSLLLLLIVIMGFSSE